MLRKKREAAITEIHELSSRIESKERPFPSYSLSIHNLKTIKVGL
jgi:hypothetical protein